MLCNILEINKFTMGRLTYVAVLTLLYLQWGESALPLRPDKEYVFGYSGVVTARSSASEDQASQWTIDAYLRMQAKGKDITMKFDDIRTSLFNGNLENLKDNKVKPIPKEANKLALPFVVHYNEKNGSALSISHQSDDPLWSLNMKKAIASIFQLDTEHSQHYLNGTTHYEDGIYGICEAKYTVVEDKPVLRIWKTIEDGACVNELEDNWSNLAPAPVMPKDFKPITTFAERMYRFEKNDLDSSYDLVFLESNATIIYQTMLDEPSNLQIIQGQVFRGRGINEITHPIDVTKNTETTSLVFEFDKADESSGRSPKWDVDAAQIIRDIRETYADFTEEFHKYPLKRGVNNTLMYLMNIINSMDEINEMMDLNTFNVLISENEPVEKMFISLLPYIGTNDTVQMIKNIIESSQIDHYFKIKLLATFPKYVKKYTPELLEKMEGLMNAEKIEMSGMKLMTFASMVAEASKHKDVSPNHLEKYHKKYTQLFKDAKDYDHKMGSLIGLINMGTLLDANTMISIIVDEKELYHVRSLASYGFKPYLASNPEKMFDNLWPIVQNQAEHFDVRVAVLDLLMSSNLTQTEFDTIIEEFKKETDDRHIRSLQNYLSTTLKSIQNTTMFPEYLGDKVADVIDLIPSYYDSWTTGNYRLSYTDLAPNFGGYLQARLVSNPITNGLTSIQLTSSQFAMSKSLGTFTAYIKLDGFADSVFMRSLTGRSNRDIPVPELLDILKKFNYKLVENRDIFVDIELFCDDRIVFAINFNKDTIRSFINSPDILLKIISKYESVTFPTMYFGNMRTDLGTHVKTYILDTDIISYKFNIDKNQFGVEDKPVKTGEFKFRSARHDMISLLAYNPLADVKIGVYKHKTFAKRAYLPFALNTTDQSIIIDNNDDSLNILSDKSLGTTVHDPEKLQTYCSSCEADMELPMKDPELGQVQLDEFGITINKTIIKGDRNEESIYSKFMPWYRGNAEAIPLAEPFVLMWYTLDYFRHFGHERNSFAARTKSLHEEPTQVVFQMFLGGDLEKRDPINGSDVFVETIITWRKKSDATVLSTLRAEYTYMSTVPSNVQNAIAQVEQKHLFRANLTRHRNIYVICFAYDQKYPDRRPDKLSISPYEPAKGKGSFSMGSTNEPDICPEEFSISFTDIAETAQHVMETVTNMKEYQICKKDSAGFKYIPPTDACSAVHDAVSMYTNYTMYLDLKNAGKMAAHIQSQIPNSENGFKFLESNYISKNVIYYKVSRDFLDVYESSVYVVVNYRDFLDSKISVGSYRGRYDPTIVAYNDYDIERGDSATCDITPSRISTFTGKDIENYDRKDGKEIVAFVECMNSSFSGMTVQKFSDKKIGFTFWSANYTLVTSVSGDKLKVALSGKELHDHHIDHYFKVYFLAGDVLYITDTVIEVYYNTEFISIKSSACINNFICGLCAPEDRRQTANEVK